MTREEALEDLARQYRVSIVLAVRHELCFSTMHGATMVTTVEELPEAVQPLVGRMLLTALERLGRLERGEPDA